MVTFYKPTKTQSVKNTNRQALRKVVTINRVNSHGEGLCINHKPIIAVSGALPGETVTVNITKQLKKIWHAECLPNSVKDANPNRQQPFCQFFSQCGGCTTQHCQSDAMLALKRSDLDNQFKRTLGLSQIPWRRSITSPHQAYRRKARLAIDARNKNQIKLGFRASSSTQIINIPSCPVLVPELQQIMLQLNQAMQDVSNNHMTRYIALRWVGHITLMQIENECSVTVHCSRPIKSEAVHWWANLATQLRPDSGRAVTVVLECNNANLAVFRSPKVSQQHTDLQATANNFMQVNAHVNNRMLALVRDCFSDTQQGPILELFSGMGNFTWQLAALSTHVVAIEGDQAMTDKASRIAQQRGITNVSFLCRQLNEPSGIRDLLQGQNYNVLLDPSRDGALAVCQQLTSNSVDKLVYISCNPQTWVRDTQILLNNGFNLFNVTLMDMFPYTPHSELFSVFTHG